LRSEKAHSRHIVGTDDEQLVKERLDADLCGVVEAWPHLPDAVRAGIVAMVREIVGGGVDEAR